MLIGDTRAWSPPEGSGLEGDARLRVAGKFFYSGDEKVLVRGVTYGPFGPEDGRGRGFGVPLSTERDFAHMRRNGINAVRTYGAPPVWLLDAAARHGLRVLVGLAWEQHVAFLDDPALLRRICSRVASDVARLSGHPAVLAYAVGNEIPASIVRWHGRERIEAFLGRLCRIVREKDPGVPVTYVNYPTTEYLDLPFLDFLSFNVYLESESDLRAYMARLQTLAGDRPLLMAELGLDALRHGEEQQARVLDWQVRAAFEEGAAGAMVFSWTDQWFRGGAEVLDWSFGLTTRERRARPSLHTVREAFERAPYTPDQDWPRMSVVVCSYNGSATLAESLGHITRLRYPDYEVIVVDDGSTDRTAEIASAFDVRLIRTPNRGLSNARNTGLAAATGEIVAYIDDDAFPDPDWLTYLAAAFRSSTHDGIGGPNIPPDDEGFVARCVARAPGGPIHVLVSDTEAEHLPGCNMAFRTDRLRAVGGFDPTFRAAGDDVDVCWRIQARGWTLGFAPAAVVWHRRRASVAAYWRQQKGYGRAEAMLERKWPEKYNRAGHVSWSGRLYDGTGSPLLVGGRTRIYHGTWGTAPFQQTENGPPSLMDVVASMPEAWLALAILAFLGVLGLAWEPLLAAGPLAILAAVPLSGRAIRAARRACRGDRGRGTADRLRVLLLTSVLHVAQPLARLAGRMSAGLAPWRRHVSDVPASLRNGSRAAVRNGGSTLWSEHWRAPEAWIQALEDGLRARGLVVLRGGGYDRWDLEARGGALGSIKAAVTVEEHGWGHQLVRVRLRRVWGTGGLLAAAVAGAFAFAAAFDGAWFVTGLLGGVSLLVLLRTAGDQRAAVASTVETLERLRSGKPLAAQREGEHERGNGASPAADRPRRVRTVRPRTAAAAGAGIGGGTREERGRA